jgi:hypothetical protein
MASFVGVEAALVQAFEELAQGAAPSVTLTQARDGYLRAIRDLNSHYGVALFETRRQREVAEARAKREAALKEQAERDAKARADKEARHVLDTEAARTERIKRAEAHLKRPSA